MIVLSKNTYGQITKHRVAARIEGITLNNLPLSDGYDHKVGLESGDLYSYQMEHLPIEGQIVLAEHQLNKALNAISAWRRKNSKDGIDMCVGLDDKERFSVFKDAPRYLGSQMNAALKPFAEIDSTIFTEWKRLGDEYEANIHKIEAAHPKTRGFHKKKMVALTPILVNYLDAVDSFVTSLREVL